MSRCIFALMITFAGLTLMSPALAAVDAAKLRQAVPLPGISVSFGYQASDGLIVFQNKQDQAAQETALKKQVTEHAEDASGWYRRGRFFIMTQNVPEAKQAFAQAAALYQAQTKSRPDDVSLLVGYGKALDATEEPEQAEAVLRRAVKLAPQDAPAWVALGWVLAGQVYSVLLTPEQQQTGLAEFNIFSLSPEQSAALKKQLEDYKPTPEQAKHAQQRLDEVLHCFDQSVLVQPKNPAGYAARGMFRLSAQAPLQALVEAVSQKKETLSEAIQALPASAGQNGLSRPGGLMDLQQSAQIAPHDLPVVASAAMFNALSILLQFSAAHADEDFAWAAVAPENRQTLEQEIVWLEQIAQGKDAADAAQAANAAGIMWMFAKQPRKAEADFRIALARNPQNQSALETLIALMMEDKRYTEASVLAKQQVKLRETVDNRLMLAKIYDKMDQAAQVKTQVDAALKDEPENLSATLAQAVLFLRRSDDPAAMTQAKALLDRAGTLYEKNQTPDNWKRYAVTISAYNALSGSEAEARKQLDQVLAADKNNKEAKQVLEALGPPEAAKPSPL